MIAKKYLNFSAEYLAAEIFYGQESRHDGSFSGKSCKQAGRIGQDSDVDGCRGGLLRANAKRADERDEFAPPHVRPPRPKASYRLKLAQRKGLK
jgi:hypothetical protein